MKHITIYSLMIVCSVFTSLLVTSCNSDLNSNIKDDPYSGGKAPLGIGLLAESPSPESAYPNDTVVFKAKGMLNWCDPQSGRYDFKFYISDEETKIVTATDTTITVKVPGNLSSGTAYIVLKEQVFYGPRLTVLGNIKIDQSYGFKGTSGPIYDCAEHYSKARVYYPVGDYMQAYYNENSSQSFSCISMVLTDGSVSGKWVTDFKLDPGQGAGIDLANPGVTDIECYLNSFTYFPSDHRVLLSGKFSEYGWDKLPVNNITIATNEVASYYKTVALPSKKNNTSINCKIPVFNGGTLEAPVRTFITSNEKVVAVGNITNYCRINTEKSYAESMVLDYSKVASVLRMSRTGELDDSYRRDAEGVIGQILDACMVESDGIVIVGTFSSFDGQSVPAQSVVMLNDDGTRDEIFKIGKMEGGLANFACLLDNDNIVVSGAFTKYDGVTRRGFLILGRDGKALQQFNVPGIFQGELYKVIETRTSTNSNGLLLLGDFSRFDGNMVRNAIMIEVDYE